MPGTAHVDYRYLGHDSEDKRMVVEEEEMKMDWEFTWIGKLRNRKPAIRFALLNLWKALNGYDLTIVSKTS